ncbi:hypothetical protein ACIP3U_33775 [[Kitasatospora] papulosa]|uniref:hypothetical protein n=1 Tax=[Kitasatospora] papulosa TaxID=1464011 RepID=UPI0015E8559F|nr:hypothetical protein [Streptomyces sp. FT05W]
MADGAHTTLPPVLPSALMSSLDAYVQLAALSWMEKPAGTVDGTRAAIRDE